MLQLTGRGIVVSQSKVKILIGIAKLRKTRFQVPGKKCSSPQRQMMMRRFVQPHVEQTPGCAPTNFPPASQ